jgi:uncharacterized phage protein (TIGR02216 family)
MWSFGREYLRLSTEEFWRLTPREYTALCKVHDERVRRDAWMMYRAFHDAEALLTEEQREEKYYADMIRDMDQSIAIKNSL